MRARRQTLAQINRRGAIRGALRRLNIVTPDELRHYLAARRHIYVTVDTVARDLRAMWVEGTVRKERHPTAGHTMGNNSWVAYTGWSLIPDE